MFKTSAICIDGIIGPRFTFLPKTSVKIDKLFETMVFKKLGVRQQRRIIPEKWEIKRAL